MRSWPKICIFTAVFVLLALSVSFAQSLPEVARQQRLKQQARDAKAAKKVITDDDMPSRPDAADDPNTNDDDNRDEPSPAVKKAAKSAAQWKAQIQAQENVVNSLQDEIKKLSASVHFVEVNRYSNGVQYNQYQARKQEEVDRLQKQLDGEQKKLDDMQEAARKAGFGSAVYEP